MSGASNSITASPEIPISVVACHRAACLSTGMTTDAQYAEWADKAIEDENVTGDVRRFAEFVWSDQHENHEVIPVD
jgi:hypothetical protein